LNCFFSGVAENTTSNGPAPRRVLRTTQATPGIDCPKPPGETHGVALLVRDTFCALRHEVRLATGQVLFESKNLTATPSSDKF
jgi:hypothetical protein